ncbi:cyclopropane fatty-acyl-phospholipid synthase-like methyltransferase [Streptomyces griseus]
MLRPGASILELGCGAGRVTHPLVARGFEVTAVDESPGMLERVRGARTVLSPIETLGARGVRLRGRPLDPDLPVA